MNLSCVKEFAGLVRTRSTNIIGFTELLADERIALSPGRRVEYAGIIHAEVAALERDMRRLLQLPPARPG